VHVLCTVDHFLKNLSAALFTGKFVEKRIQDTKDMIKEELDIVEDLIAQR
jgi:hypothetical protein